MAIDFSRIKQAQAKAQTKGGFEKIDYTKIYFKPVLGKQTIRVVPNKLDSAFPFLECELHNYNAFKKYIPTLRNFGEKDPIVDFRKKVFDKGSEEDKAQVKKFAPTVKKYVQVVVRGQEGLGVRLWELNKTNFDALASILGEEDYGNCTDIVEGRDITVEGVNDSMTKDGKTVNFVACKMNVSVKVSPLSKDATQVEEWLEKQHLPLEQYKKYTYEEIEQILSDYLDPQDQEEGEEDTPPAPTPAAKAVAALKPKPAPAVKKVEPVVEEIEAEEITGEDELSDVIPQVAPTPAPAKKAPAKPAAPTSTAKKFARMFEDDED